MISVAASSAWRLLSVLDLRFYFSFFACFIASSAVGHAQNLVGQLAPDFTLPIWEEAASVSLSDYEGSIIVLDFFAYWCPPCQTSSPDLEANVQEYYAALGGTPEGIPVHVLPVNIEANNPPATNTFIANAGLELVLDDSASRSVYSHYSTGGIPLFVIINGVADSPSHEQWEILHHSAGYHGSTYFRSVINQVEAAQEVGGAPEIEVSFSGTTINDDDTTPSVGTGTEFGSVDLGDSATHTFRVNNTGTAVLSLGTETSSSGEFAVNSLSSSIPAGGYDDFTVSFSPASAGTKTATISFSTNDSDENPFDFVVSGVGAEPVDYHGDSIAEASLIADDSITDGALTRGDSDYFRIDLDGSGTLVVHTTGNTNTYGLLYDDLGVPLAGDNDSGTGLNFEISHSLSAAGAVYLQVRGNDASTAGAYQLVISFTPTSTPAPWFGDASETENGWRYYDWFKGFKPEGENWIYHVRHGWLYVIAEGTSGMFLWDVALGRWMFTNETIYPWMYAYGPDEGWLFFFEGGRPGSRFFKRGDNAQVVSEQDFQVD